MTGRQRFGKRVRETMAGLQDRPWARRTLITVMAILTVSWAGYFLYDLLPRTYELTITGGEIVGNRHYLAKVLQEEVRAAGVTLVIKPTNGASDALEKLSRGELDIALVQSGLEEHHPDVVHVATLAPELLHFLARADIKSVADLKGRSINLGARNDGIRVVAKQVLATAGLEEGIDYVETNYSTEELLSMRADRLPDVVVNISYVPSQLAEFLVRERGYGLLEIPFPGSLAVRLGWVAEGRILGYMYSITPPVPPRDMQTIGVNLHVLANRRTDSKALEKVLEALYSHNMQDRVHEHFDEHKINAEAEFPLSEATILFQRRSQPMMSPKTMDTMKSASGLVVSVLSGVFVLLRALRAGSSEAERFRGYLSQLAEIERDIRAVAPRPDAAYYAAWLDGRLSELKEKALADYAEAEGELDGTALVENLLTGIADSRSRIAPMLAQAAMIQAQSGYAAQ